MKKYTIALLPGDGIGPEIAAEAKKVIDVIQAQGNAQFECTEGAFGGNAYLQTGKAFPPETIEVCDAADAIIKGPIGLNKEKSDEIPVDARLIVATNTNDILAQSLTTGKHKLEEVTPTITPSMDIQIASNFERLLFEIYDRNGLEISRHMEALNSEGGYMIDPKRLDTARSLFTGIAIDETQTLNEMARVHAETGLLIDPHTAVGVAAGRMHLATNDALVVSLATADPAKFPDSVERATGQRPKPPDRLAEALASGERYDVLTRDLKGLQAYIRNRSRVGI